MFLPAACALGQGAPQFRAAGPGVLPLAVPASPLFPALTTQVRPALRATAPQLIRLTPEEAAKPAESLPRADSVQRAAETPLALQRRPTRNSVSGTETIPFTLRTTSGDAIMGQVSLGLKTALWFNDNLTNAPHDRAVEESILEITPILQINLGSPPGPRLEKSRDTEYYAQVLYMPTVHTLLGEGTSRTLQRVIAEIGRANVITSAGVQFEHDENIFGAQGDNSAEDSYTFTELSPFVTYSPSAKTTLRAQGYYRRISLDDPVSNRTEYVLDAGIDWEASVKTSIGVGSEIGNIDFDVNSFGSQRYEQAYVSFAWKPSPKLTFRTRAGVELRQFDREPAKPERVSPVIIAALNYAPDTATHINVGLRVRNEPSVSQTGALLQEIRLGVDARRDLGWNLYARGEVALVRRDYDTTLEQFETTVRTALGYRTELGRVFDSLNIEVFYQYRRGDSNAPDADYGRNILGIESTILF